jgi:hypothetical protein
MKVRALQLFAAIAVLVVVPASAAPTAQTVVGARWISGGAELQHYDARTLRRVGPALRVRMPGWPWSRAPDGGRVALAAGGNGAPGRLLLLDARPLRRLGSVPIAFESVAGSAWLRADRLLVLGRRDARTVGLVLVDPQDRRIVRETSVAGQLVGAERTRDGLAVLLGPAAGIGSTRLLIVDAELAVRDVALPRISGGWRYGKGLEPETPTSFRRPGLAVDTAAARAYVVGAPGEPVAEVALASGDVSYRSLVLRRPSRAAKALAGTNVSARALGAGRLAVWGVTYDGLDERTRAFRHTPLGLWLVDMRTLTPRLLDPTVEGIVAHGRWLVWPDGLGLTWWNAVTGTRRQAFVPRDAVEVAVVGDRALVRLYEEADSHLLDLRTGARLGMRRGSPPVFYAGAGAVMY